MQPTDLIRRFEGCKLQAYPDPASPLAKGKGTDGRPWTVGYGCTGPGIHEGLVISQDEAEQMLEHRVAPLVDCIQALVKVPLTDAQLSALASFEWNEGDHRLFDPRCKILPMLNSGDYLSAAGQFLHWTAANGIRGFLQGRREAELLLFMDGLLE